MIQFEELLGQLSTIQDAQLEQECCKVSREDVLLALKGTLRVLFPAYFSTPTMLKGVNLLQEVQRAWTIVFQQVSSCSNRATLLADQLLSSLVEVKRLALTDLQAIYDGDPAATSKNEVLLCYPGFYAILVYRIAHVCYQLNIPIVPRMLSEHAHTKTGIDINPGAKIGPSFCIDHGTGIVIGETAVIGSHVKLYQGVTIGARSFTLDAEGHPVKGGKRHPNIGNHVVIYANATILGGDTTIGDGCEIGGNTFILHSVPSNSKVKG